MKIIFGRTYDKMDLSIRIRVIYVGSILGRKGMRAIFQKKGKKRAKKEKIFENLDKNVPKVPGSSPAANYGQS